MTEIYTIYGGDMWREALNGVVTVLGTNSFTTLMRIVSTFGVLGVVAGFIKTRNPLEFVKWTAMYVGLTSAMLVPRTSVQIIDITDQAAVYEVDNVPSSLAAIAHITTGIGYGMARTYDMALSRPDAITYTKSGMLFGSQIIAQTTDFQTQNPELSAMLPDYVENCVVGDILLNHKYTVNDLVNSQDPLTLITSNPSPLRGIYITSSGSRQFETCQQAAAQIQTLVGQDTQINSPTFSWLTSRIYGNRINGAALLSQSMGDSYGYFYSGGLSAAQVMKNNITNSAIRSGLKGFAARSDDTANLVNLASETAMTKQRLAWSTMSAMATRYLPFMQSLLMLILVCLFPLVVALAAANHSIFGLTTLKYYVGGFLYFQMWPIMFAILNFAATFYAQTKTGATPLVLSNYDQVELQHSDVANMAGYLAMSIPILSFYLTKGAASIGSQVAGSVFSSMAFGSAGQAGTTADGNWSFNNMSMDNVNANKFDTNAVQRMGQQTWQASNGSSQTLTSDGHHVIDSNGAISNLPVNLRLSQLASSGFQEQARNAEVQAQTSLDGYNHSVASGWSQLSQIAHQTGNSDSLSQSSDNSQALNATRGTNMMMSATESYAKDHGISQQQAYNELMNLSNQGAISAGVGGKVAWSSKDQAFGKLGAWATGVSASGDLHASADWSHASASSHGTQDSNSETTDLKHSNNSQAVRDFRQGMDMVTSSRVTDSGNHTDNTSTSQLQQFGATLNDTKTQYHQFTDSTTRSKEYSKMASLAQNESASLDANYNQEFVDWAEKKYGADTQSVLTSTPSARAAASEFVEERLKPEIMGDYHQGRADLQSGANHDVFTSSPGGTATGAMSQGGNSAHVTQEPGQYGDGNASVHHVTGGREHSVTGPEGNNRGAMNDNYQHNQTALEQARGQFHGGEDIQKGVAEQRNANTQTISDSSHKLDENKNTVQASSDILKGENDNANGKFQLGRKEEEYAQSNRLNPVDGLHGSELKDQIEELRRRANGK